MKSCSYTLERLDIAR